MFSAQIAQLKASRTVRSAASLYTTTILTSAFGFFYWLVAARTMPAAAVGTANALQSAARLIAAIFLLGLGTLTVSELSVRARHAKTIILTNSIVAGTAGMLGAAIVVTVLALVPSTLQAPARQPLISLLVVLLTAVSGALLVIDDACVGLGRGGIQVTRNVVFAGVKLILLPMAAAVLLAAGGLPVLASWLSGAILSLALAIRLLQRALPSQKWSTDFLWLVRNRHLAGQHHWLNVSILAPVYLTPVLVTLIVGAEANAKFTTCLLIIDFVNMIPVHFSTALFALHPDDEASLRRECRASLRICFAIAGASAIFFLIFAHLILQIFRPSYTTATAAMQILGFSTFPSVVKAHYVAVARMTKRMSQAALRSMLSAAVMVTAAVIGGMLGGLNGVAIAVVAANCFEAILFGPTVLAAVRRPRIAT